MRIPDFPHSHLHLVLLFYLKVAVVDSETVVNCSFNFYFLVGDK